MIEFISTHLDDNHNTSEFQCGNLALDDWLRRQALRAQRAGISRVTIWSPASSEKQVAAYYSISPAQVVASDGLPRKATGGFSYIPAWLIGKLAVDIQFQGQGIGRDILFDAIETIISAARIGGGRVIIVDPIDERAARWYQQLGFSPFSLGEEPRRQFLLMTKAEASFGGI